MRRIIISAAAVLMAGFVTAMVPSVVMAAAAAFPKGDGDLNNGKKIFTEGKGTVPACNSCHGPEGLGDDNMGTPRIAGQFYTFLHKQLEDFASDKRTDTTMFIMNANAKGLTEQDRKDVSTYLASLRKKGDIKTANGKIGPSDLDELKAAGIAVGLPHKGKSLVFWGGNDKGIPACYSCHGFNGMGAPPVFPMIGQQRYVYLVNQLKKWRDGSRANDPKAAMQAVAKKMSDEDINNAAAYLATTSFYSGGNLHTAYDPAH